MNQQEIRNYIETYFKAFDSPFITETPSYFTVQLPVEVDKDLGNRPFYWTYVEKIGIEPNPLQLTFVFEPDSLPEGLKGEELPYGSRRLHQIFDSAKKHGKFVRLYEELGTHNGRPRSSFPLVPWLGVNYKAEFICDQKKDMLLSLGMNLISGSIIADFYQKVQSLELTPKLPDYTFTMQPIFGIDSAVEKIEGYITRELEQHDTKWAEYALERLKEEKELVESYYGEEATRQESTEEQESEHSEKLQKLLVEKNTRLQELTWQFEPRIQVSALNIGLFYLQTPLLS